jgi:hypothetical protein
MDASAHIRKFAVWFIRLHKPAGTIGSIRFDITIICDSANGARPTELADANSKSRANARQDRTLRAKEDSMINRASQHNRPTADIRGMQILHNFDHPPAVPAVP